MFHQCYFSDSPSLPLDQNDQVSASWSLKNIKGGQSNVVLCWPSRYLFHPLIYPICIQVWCIVCVMFIVQCLCFTAWNSSSLAILWPANRKNNALSHQAPSKPQSTMKECSRNLFVWPANARVEGIFLGKTCKTDEGFMGPSRYMLVQNPIQLDGGFHSHGGYPEKWSVLICFNVQNILKWRIWGYPDFRTPPRGCFITLNPSS